MAAETDVLRQKQCVPCEGGIAALPPAEASHLLRALPEWKLTSDGKGIRREWMMKDFSSGLEFFRDVGELAENEGHHPDLHLTGYRKLAIELSTHAVDGLTENDFILAAKIDELPAKVKK